MTPGGTPGMVKKQVKGHWIQIVVVAAFVFLATFIYLTSFSNFDITGKIIGGEVVSPVLGDEIKKGIEIEATFNTAPDLSLEGVFEEFELSGSSNSYLQVGNQKFPLDKVRNNFIVLEGFDGKILLNGPEITDLSGRVSGIEINGISVVPSQESGSTKVSLGGSFVYESFEITEEIAIKEINYVTSGNINLDSGKQNFKVENDEILIRRFQGNLEANKGNFQIKGIIDKLEIFGNSKVSIGK
ncbi:MAG: hypothetical protein WDZ77_02580 [Candidatus Pacearchaeota archaeon]